MLHVCTLLWDPNENSRDFSRAYDETWVDKLYRGFKRNLTIPFRFVCFADRIRRYGEKAIGKELLANHKPTYSDCLEPYRLNVPMILVGLDTLILGNIDHLAAYCLQKSPRPRLALPRDPYNLGQACNGVALTPGDKRVWHLRSGLDDMSEVRRWPHVFLDDLFPGQIVSYKGHVMGESFPFRNVPQGIDGVRICYFHGVPKMQDLTHLSWVREAWI